MRLGDRPIADRLRALVIEMAGEATLTCRFRPGGRLHGVGIRSHFYCEDCGQAEMWHVVAEGVAVIATAEEIIRSADTSREGQHA